MKEHMEVVHQQVSRWAGGAEAWGVNNWSPAFPGLVGKLFSPSMFGLCFLFVLP